MPYTASFSRANLERMIKRYGMLYVKPDVGSRGIGVYKLRRTKAGYDLYEIVRKKQLRRRFRSLTSVYNRLRKAKTGRLIIQRGISLDKVNGRSYDIRAMVQRKPRGSWVCTGLIVKAGARGRIVTNYYQGGTVYAMEKLGRLRRWSPSRTKGRVRKLTQTALRISRALSGRQSGMHEMGIDFAFDRRQRLWVLEVNSNHPQFHPLKRLNRRAYDKMMRFAASYGRHNAK